MKKPDTCALGHVLLAKSIFKPNERVNVKAWFRRVEHTEEGLPKMVLPGSGCKVCWSVRASTYRDEF